MILHPAGGDLYFASGKYGEYWAQLSCSLSGIGKTGVIGWGRDAARLDESRRPQKTTTSTPPTIFLQ